MCLWECLLKQDWARGALFCNLKIPVLSHNFICTCCTRNSLQQFGALPSAEGLPSSSGEGDLQDGQENMRVCLYVYMHTHVQNEHKSVAVALCNQLTWLLTAAYESKYCLGSAQSILTLVGAVQLEGVAFRNLM